VLTNMNRRDLLLLRATARARVFELPCERLYMQYLDARQPRVASTSAQPDYWLGEPEARFDVRSARDLFDALARELGTAEVVRVVGREWLADDQLKQEVERLIAAFVDRGGRVERD
jgi:hypothetical protein